MTHEPAEHRGAAEIRTARLRLCPYQAAERADFVALFTDPVVTRYTGGPLSPQAAARLFDAMRAGTHPRIVAAWAAWEDNAYVGHGALLRAVAPAEMAGHIEAGVLLRPPAWGRGLAVEIMQALLAWAHGPLDLPRVIATLDADHVASRRVCEKAGMRCLRQGSDEDGPYLVYGHERERKT